MCSPPGRHRRFRKGVGVIASYSQASQDAVPTGRDLKALFWITSSLSRWEEDNLVNQMGRRNSGWGAQWHCTRPPRFQSWSSSSTQRGLHDVEVPWVTLDTVAGVRDEAEVGVQRDSKDFRDLVQRCHLVTNSHLRVNQDWWVSEVNSVTLDFWAALASCFPSASLTKVEQSWIALASASTMQLKITSNCQVATKISCLNRWSQMEEALCGINLKHLSYKQEISWTNKCNQLDRKPLDKWNIPRM